MERTKSWNFGVDLNIQYVLYEFEYYTRRSNAIVELELLLRNME